MMGHSSVQVTERYARKLDETARLAAAATKFPKSSPLASLGSPSRRQKKLEPLSGLEVILCGLSGDSCRSGLEARRIDVSRSANMDEN